jgi:predicted TIM-barrel fold metal-dependent hydrolase
MVIDFHTHCFPDGVVPKAIPLLAERAGISNVLDGTVKGLKDSMLESGIDISVIQSIATRPSQTESLNNWSCEVQDSGIISFGSIHPDFTGWKNELARIKELGIKGIKMHPDYQLFDVDEKRLYPIYQYAFELGFIVLFHAGNDIGLYPPCHCTPERLSKVVRDFPGGVIVAAHMGGYSRWDDVERYLVGLDLYFDTSYCLGKMDDVQAKRIIENHGYERILFATDSPWTSQKEEVQKLKGLGLEECAKKAILGENARKLLKI